MARIRLDRDMPDDSGFTPRPVVDEQTKAAAMRAAAPAVTPVAPSRSNALQNLKNDSASTAVTPVVDEQTKAAAMRSNAPTAVTSTRSGITAQAGTRLAATLAQQNEARAARDAAFANKPTEDPGPGNRWVWQERNQTWARVFFGDSGGLTNNNLPVNQPPANQPSPTATLVSTETDDFGNVVGFYSDGTSKTLITSGNKYKSTVDVDAYTLLENTFKDYGLEELVPEIKRFMEEGLGSNQAAVELRKTTAYINRFRGNEIRRQTGLNVLSEATYLQLENSYNETLRAFGLQGYFGTDRKVAQTKMADIIGNDISADEFNKRIDTVVTRVNNAEPAIKNTLRAFYNITDTDLVKYFLNPKESLPKLEEKVLSAEIGTEAIRQNLLTDVTGATALAQLGITKEQARRGYQSIAGVLPTAQKLADIYGEERIDYTQATAEQEVFGELESAKRKRTKLAEKEIGSFSGSSGLARGALGTGSSGTF